MQGSFKLIIEIYKTELIFFLKAFCNWFTIEINLTAVVSNEYQIEHFSKKRAFDAKNWQNPKPFSTPYHFSGWTASPSLPQRR